MRAWGRGHPAHPHLDYRCSLDDCLYVCLSVCLFVHPHLRCCCCLHGPTPQSTIEQSSGAMPMPNFCANSRDLSTVQSHAEVEKSRRVPSQAHPRSGLPRCKRRSPSHRRRQTARPSQACRRPGFCSCCRGSSSPQRAVKTRQRVLRWRRQSECADEWQWSRPAHHSVCRHQGSV